MTRDKCNDQRVGMVALFVLYHCLPLNKQIMYLLYKVHNRVCFEKRNRDYYNFSSMNLTFLWHPKHLTYCSYLIYFDFKMADNLVYSRGHVCSQVIPNLKHRWQQWFRSYHMLHNTKLLNVEQYNIELYKNTLF